MNKIVLSGRVASDIEIKDVGEHKKGSFRLAVRNPRKKDETSFFNIDVWGKASEVVEKWAPKGSFLIVSGRLEQHTWKTDDGQNRERVLVVADDVELGPKASQSDEKQDADSGDDIFGS